MVITAVRDIEQGEEITIPYTELLAPARERRLLLAPYGFVCDCPACEGDDTTLHDSHRLTLLHFNKQLDEYEGGMSELDAKVALGIATSVVHLLRGTQITGKALDEVYHRCADYAALAGDQELAQGFRAFVERVV
ncbi:hypothetical protein PG985_003796 [Apiospora marii]|uniref:SET domain-containing protein n=1 Tax=Apiospora marii TaxID=335849 RepID=A0ABR1SH14_9PEZI